MVQNNHAGNKPSFITNNQWVTTKAIVNLHTNLYFEYYAIIKMK